MTDPVVVVRVVEQEQRLPDGLQATAVRLEQERVDEHRRRRSCRDHPSGQEQDHVGPTGVGQVVGRDDDRPSPGALLVDGRVDELARDGVEPGDRLVEQEQLGLLGQALGDEGALALPAGQLAQLAASQVGEVHALEGGAHGVTIARAEAMAAWRIIRSREGRIRESAALFEQILARSADATGLTFFADRLLNARGIEGVTSDLASSTEAFNEAQKRDTLLVLVAGNRIRTADAETLRSAGAEVTFPSSVMTNPQLGIAPGTQLVVRRGFSEVATRAR